MRVFYEACSFFLLPYHATMTNPFGWGPSRPREQERTVKPEAHWDELALVFGANVGMLSGIGIFLSGSELIHWRVILASILIAAGVLCLVGAMARAWRRVGFPPMGRRNSRRGDT